MNTSIREQEEWPYDRECPECGKTFTITCLDDWAYYVKSASTKGRRFFCSYRCIRQWKQRKEEKTAQGKEDRERQRKIMEMINVGASTETICQTLDVSRQAVNYYMMKARKAGRR